jgi:hypothetical protein
LYQPLETISKVNNIAVLIRREERQQTTPDPAGNKKGLGEQPSLRDPCVIVVGALWKVLLSISDRALYPFTVFVTRRAI